jgi:hypothetical protein
MSDPTVSFGETIITFPEFFIIIIIIIIIIATGYGLDGQGVRV